MSLSFGALGKLLYFLWLTLTWLVCGLFSFIFIFRQISACRRRGQKPTVAFFHPYCNAGGGGERVLWCALQTLQERYKSGFYEVAVFTGDTDAAPEEIIKNVQKNFNIKLDGTRVRFVYLKWRRLVEADLYPVFTLILQSLGGLMLGAEALYRFCPDVLIDSMGYPFTLPLFRYFGACRVGCYVHYPVISSDMLQMVADRRHSYNNASVVSRSAFLSYLKLQYYRLFAKLYGLVGRSSNLVMVNSSWTRGHIEQIWKVVPTVVYPPCDVSALKALECKSEERFEEEVRILSVAQFRPEKNHRMQIESFCKLRHLWLDGGHTQRLTLVLAGSCRHAQDRERVRQLQQFASELGVDGDIDWRLNISFDELVQEFSCALIGLHTMWNEHFGIGVVEGLAAGNIMVAHDSGGPRLDICRAMEDGRPVGFLAHSPDTYATAMLRVLLMSYQQRHAIRSAAKERADQFSQSLFCDRFYELVRDGLL